jgi:hypothetical protein
VAGFLNVRLTSHHVPISSLAKLKRDANLMEKVQRRFTKAIKGLRYLTYVERLRELLALTIANRMMYSDTVFIHKCLHGKVNVAASDLGLFPRSSNTRGDGHRLIQRHTNNRTSHLFCFVLCLCGISYLFTLCLATPYLFSRIVYIVNCFNYYYYYYYYYYYLLLLTLISTAPQLKTINMKDCECQCSI